MRRIALILRPRFQSLDCNTWSNFFSYYIAFWTKSGSKYFNRAGTAINAFNSKSFVCRGSYSNLLSSSVRVSVFVAKSILFRACVLPGLVGTRNYSAFSTFFVTVSSIGIFAYYCEYSEIEPNTIILSSVFFPN